MAGITGRLEQQYPGTNRNAVVTPLKEKVVGQIETPLLVLLGAVAFVLLITCANVAHMLLARAATRQKEVAVRAALGARRGRIIRQFLTESLLLGGVGGAAGLMLAWLGTRGLIAMSPANIPRVQTVTIDIRAALFLFGATILTSVGFGLAPALQASSVNVNDTLKEGGRRQQRRIPPESVAQPAGGFGIRAGADAADRGGPDDSHICGVAGRGCGIQSAQRDFDGGVGGGVDQGRSGPPGNFLSPTARGRAVSAGRAGGGGDQSLAIGWRLVGLALRD